jgi:Family of unknown function (DUF6521)
VTLWTERPQEVAYLLNPAFTGLVLLSAIQGHAKEGQIGIPFPLIFLVLPIVLHEPTLQSLPHRITSSMPAWLQENPEAMVNLPERAHSFRPFTQESLRFMSSRRMVSISSTGLLCTGSGPAPSAHKQKLAMGEAEYSAIAASAFIGRWFARSGDVATIMTLWGVRP